MTWNRKLALKKGKAVTRDGRNVFFLKEAVLDGETVLIGDIEVNRVKHKDSGWETITLESAYWEGGGWETITLESAYWEAGGLGRHGGDDLVNV